MRSRVDRLCRRGELLHWDQGKLCCYRLILQRDFGSPGDNRTARPTGDTKGDFFVRLRVHFNVWLQEKLKSSGLHSQFVGSFIQMDYGLAGCIGNCIEPRACCLVGGYDTRTWYDSAALVRDNHNKCGRWALLRESRAGRECESDGGDTGDGHAGDGGTLADKSQARWRKDNRRSPSMLLRAGFRLRCAQDDGSLGRVQQPFLQRAMMAAWRRSRRPAGRS
jgi:hypothetical protein